MKTETSTIIWTWTDEAPALATLSFLPIVRAFTKGTGVSVETWDISLAGRIIANFPEYLTEAQRIPDHLAQLGELTQVPEANIIKLPNISASIPQLKDAIKELQAQGIQGSGLPGESERRCREGHPGAIREGARQRRQSGDSRGQLGPPLAALGEGVREEAPHQDGRMEPGLEVPRGAHDRRGFLRQRERPSPSRQPAEVRYEFVAADGTVTVLKKKMALPEGEILDTSVMHVRALRSFYEEQIEDAKRQGLLLSLHLKATMMKVSDPVLFGHAVSVYFKPVFEKHAATFKQLGVNPDNGLGDLYAKIQGLPAEKKAEIEADIKAVYAIRPPLAMVDSDRGITNLHVPSDIIIDASMPAMIRDSGRMWGPDGKLHDTKAMLPDRCYSTIYKTIVEDCKQHGAFDQATMGSVPNVGLMAQEAEEYGSHDKTFIASGPGTIRVVSEATGETLLEQKVEEGDVFRSCQTKDAAIRDWVKLAVRRARATGAPAVFWLDKNRAHDAQVIKKVELYLKDHDTTGLDIRIMEPVEAMKFSLERIRKGQDTISVTGNVIRDYLTDLFPILEIGTSGKMLSIVPLLAGGGLFETGAGGSAPKHVQQFQKEGYLRWDSLGEFSALGASLEHLGATFQNERAALLAETLDQAIGKFLDNNRSPARKVGEIDNRGSHFYLAMYWAEALAAQSKDKELQTRFAAVAKQLIENEAKINAELLGAQAQARRHGRVLPSGPGQDDEGDAAEPDAERHHRRHRVADR